MHDRLITCGLLLSSLLAFALLAYSAYEENFAADWYMYQSQYRRTLIATATSEREGQIAERYGVAPKQLFLPELDRIDRCVTCHAAIDNPAMADATLPLAPHPGDIMANHAKERFGCTVCHRGQGRATVAADAHGHTPHWPDPMVSKEQVYRSCIRCHAERSLAGAGPYNEAMSLIYDKACLACHKLRGKGGDVGPILDRAGEIHDAEWHFKHFKDPKSVVATSEMPNLDLSDEQAQLLTELMMGLTSPPIPADLLSIPQLRVAQTPTGDVLDPLALEDFVGSKFCISCHAGTHPDAVHGWRESRMTTTFDRIRDEPIKDNCLPCHTTGYNANTGHFAEEGVSCEGCHGPGKEAVKRVLGGKADDHRRMLRLNPDSTLVCVRCHNPHVPIGTHADHYRQLPPRDPHNLATAEPKFESIPPGDDIPKVRISVSNLIHDATEPAVAPTQDLGDETGASPTTGSTQLKRPQRPPHAETVLPETASPQPTPAATRDPVSGSDSTRAVSDAALAPGGEAVSPAGEGALTESDSPAAVAHRTEPYPALQPTSALGEQKLATPKPKSGLVLPAMPSREDGGSPYLDQVTRQLEANAGCTSRGCHTEMIAGVKVHGPTAVGLCVACHRMVDPVNHRFELTEQQPGLCFQCHEKPPEAKYLHGPVALGMCTACHNPHSGPERLMLRADGQELCFTCHTEMGKHVHHAQVQHGAIKEKGCTACHDPHRENHRYQLKQDLPELCLECHKEIAEIVDAATTHHGALTIKKKCVNCHNPHGSNVPQILRAVEMDLCLSCHDEPMETPTGPIIDMKSWIENNPERHGPIRLKLCTACHQPHGSTHFRILTHYFPPEFYRPFDLDTYELCFQCHEQALVLHETTETLTGFRNGETNLHFVHVNQEKGRTCRACHEIHAGTKPKRIKDYVPFGMWNYPVNFEKNEHGGGCAPGCHVPRRYDRREEIIQK